MSVNAALGLTLFLISGDIPICSPILTSTCFTQVSHSDTHSRAQIETYKRQQM